MSTQLSHIGEFGLIERIKKGISLSSSVDVGIGDDAAVINLSKEKKLLFTTDMLIEGIHFTAQDKPFLIGRKALAVSISDIAAMGGLPKSAVVSVGLPKGKTVNFVKNLYAGINQLAQKFQVDIVGGDTAKSREMVINIALIGEVRSKDLIKRSTARVGDKIFVSGPLGNSYKSKHHFNFIPRIKESQYLVAHFKPTSMIDVSDGLAADLGHVLKSSGVSAILFETKIPLKKGATVHKALTDGEDFELLFTLSRHVLKRVDFSNVNFPFYEIGEILSAEQKPCLVSEEGKKELLTFKGYTHF